MLRDALIEAGLRPATSHTPPSRPTVADLSAVSAAEVLDLYHVLGGVIDSPTFRPGAWDLLFVDWLVVELDEELHFNRYRATTLASSWEQTLPWTTDCRRHCSVRRSDCLSAGAWGKRWTNDSAGRMFAGGPPGELAGDGAPRWKQRGLYDALKDTAPLLSRHVHLARVATHDAVNGVSLGAVLDGLVPVECGPLLELVRRRTA